LKQVFKTVGEYGLVKKDGLLPGNNPAELHNLAAESAYAVQAEEMK
jgi:hypothetical protein